MARTSFSARSHAVLGTALAALCLVPGPARLEAQDAAPGPTPVLREQLVSGLPPSAPGQELQLVRFVIQPGTTLPPHTHPGTQVGWIESGTLHYVVVGGGESSVHRKGTDGRPGERITLRPGHETDLRAGDTIVEPEHLVHYGANRGSEPVVIWVAALLRQGQPPSEVVENAAPGVGAQEVQARTQSSITDEMMGRQHGAMPLRGTSSDPGYGYSQEKPVPVGGGLADGRKNVYRYLNGLRGPEGQDIRYSRVGSCCGFKTKNSPLGSGLLDVYGISYEGAPARRLYFNWYESGEVLIPVGLTATIP